MPNDRQPVQVLFGQLIGPGVKGESHGDPLCTETICDVGYAHHKWSRYTSQGEKKQWDPSKPVAKWVFWTPFIVGKGIFGSRPM